MPPVSLRAFITRIQLRAVSWFVQCARCLLHESRETRSALGRQESQKRPSRGRYIIIPKRVFEGSRREHCSRNLHELLALNTSSDCPWIDESPLPEKKSPTSARIFAHSCLTSISRYVIGRVSLYRARILIVLVILIPNKRSMTDYRWLTFRSRC